MLIKPYECISHAIYIWDAFGSGRPTHEFRQVINNAWRGLQASAGPDGVGIPALLCMGNSLTDVPKAEPLGLPTHLTKTSWAHYWKLVKNS